MMDEIRQYAHLVARTYTGPVVHPSQLSEPKKEEENHEDRQSKRLQRETDRITTPGCACVSSVLRDAITQGTTTAP
jgi:hypothetical protein